MEGTPADLTVYIDEDIAHDHTYFGNGCPNGWGTDGDGGSITPCSTRIVKDGNDENQKIGTYFNFQAATSGTSGAMTTQNTDSPDTFCPLGWQLPYSGKGGDYYDKSKSWKYLFSTYNIVSETSEGLQIIRKYPHNYVYSGYFRVNNGRLYNQTRYGHYWSSTIATINSAFRLTFGGVSALRYDEIPARGDSEALRCDFVEISNLKALHGIRVHSLAFWLFIF